MIPYWTDSFGNPSSVHTPGRRARAAVDQARESIADALRVNPQEIVFTSGGTEAANLALSAAFRSGLPVAASRAEHEAVLKPLEAFESFGGRVHWLETSEYGAAVMPPLGQVMDFDGMIACMLVNNETGAYNSPERIRRVFPSRTAIYFADSVQALAYGEVEPAVDTLDLFSLSAHKIGGPKGVGLLCNRSGIELTPTLRGGAQEAGRRAGTENVAGIVGFAKAVELAKFGKAERASYVRGLNTRLRRLLLDAFDDLIVVNTPPDPDAVPHILNIAFVDDEHPLDGEMILLNLDIEGVFVSSGSACTSGSLKPSHVLLAAGLTETAAATAVRFSLSHRTSEADIDYAVERLVEIHSRMARGRQQRTTT